jgi:hypothetical protein
VMRKVLVIAIPLVGSLASAGALGFQEFAPSVGGRRIVALARDDGRYANSPLKSWFDRLASGKGLCRSFADGFRVDDVDWNTQAGRSKIAAAARMACAATCFCGSCLIKVRMFDPRTQRRGRRSCPAL